MICPKFWNLTLIGGSWRGAVQEMINHNEPIHAAKKKITIFNGPFWVISGDVTSPWTQKAVEHGNLPKIPSIQPGKKEI